VTIAGAQGHLERKCSGPFIHPEYAAILPIPHGFSDKLRV
jgi:hypothetical protein